MGGDGLTSRFMVAIPLALLISGCVSFGGSPEKEVVYVTQTTTTSSTPTSPPTYFKLNVIYNQVGRSLEVQAQAYSLSSNGNPNFYGFKIRSMAVGSKETNTYPQLEWPLCNDSMEGIKIRVLEGGTEQKNGLWSGMHCSGDSRQYFLIIGPDFEMRMGTYEGQTPAAPKPVVATPRVIFSEDPEGRTLTVTETDAGVNWTDIQSSGCGFGSPYGRLVRVGDVIQVSVGAEPCLIQVIFKPNGAVLFQARFEPDQQSAPTISLSRDESNDRLSLASAGSDAAWNRLYLKADAEGTAYALNQAATLGTASNVSSTYTQITANPDSMEAGEYIEFCSTGGGPSPMTYTILDGPTNSVIGSFTFSEVAAC